jgi:protein TonB
VAIIAAILLHIAVVTPIDDGFQREKTRDEAPVPVEIVTEQPKPQPSPPPPEPKPVEKPPEQVKPPEPQKPPQSSGGDLQDKEQGALPAPPAADDKPPPPTTTPPPATPEPPAPAAAPTLPNVASPDAIPVPPASSPRATQQTMLAPPLPPKKPPAPPARQTSTAKPPQPETPSSSTTQELQLGEGGGNKYLNAMRDQLLRKMVYPPTADYFHLTGRAKYQLTLDRQGQVLDAQLIRSTGYAILDKAGFQTIQRAAPFGPVPPDLTGDSISIDLTLDIGPPSD